MITADADRVPVRHLEGAILDEIDRESQRGFRRIDVGVPCNILFENIVLCSAPQGLLLDALFYGYSPGFPTDRVHLAGTSRALYTALTGILESVVFSSGIW